MNKIHVFILSGGSGTRLWPLSTPDEPKQFHSFFSGKSLLQEAVERARSLAGDNVWIVTGKSLFEQTINHLPDFPEDHILAEPVSRNTAGSVAWALANASIVPDNVMVVLPSDHWIDPPEEFVTTILKAVKCAEKGWICIIGVKPERPETAFGYLVPGEDIFPGAFRVKRFREKPPQEEASSMIKEGALWNAGIFVMRADVVEKAFEESAPEYARFLKASQEGVSEEAFAELPSEQFDRAVLERFSRVCGVRASFKWKDLGTWDSLAELESFSGLFNEQVVLSDAEGTRVFSFTDKPVAVHGIKNAIVVVAEGGVLVIPKGESGKVREIYRKIIEKLKRG